jgi:hypothetical protein
MYFFVTHKRINKVVGADKITYKPRGAMAPLGFSIFIKLKTCIFRLKN